MFRKQLLRRRLHRDNTSDHLTRKQRAQLGVNDQYWGTAAGLFGSRDSLLQMLMWRWFQLEMELLPIRPLARDGFLTLKCWRSSHCCVSTVKSIYSALGARRYITNTFEPVMKNRWHHFLFSSTIWSLDTASSLLPRAASAAALWKFHILPQCPEMHLLYKRQNKDKSSEIKSVLPHVNIATVTINYKPL